VVADATTLPAKTPAEKKAESDAALAAALGITKAMINTYPELQAVFDLWNAGKEAQAKAAFNNTNFFKNNNQTVRERLTAQANQPGAYAKNLEDYKIKTRKRLVTAGVKIDDATFTNLVNNAYTTGMTDDQVDQYIIAHGLTGKIGGTTGGDVADLQAYARSFGVGGYFDKAYWSQKSTDLFAGNTTSDDIQADIRSKAASAFPAYASQINNGVSVDAIASAYRGSIASILEVDPDSITYDNKYLKQALQTVDANGQPTTKPIWQFEKELRQTKDWEYTNNARDTIDNLSLKVLRDWGLA
jgi:hypothetical protein